jgi:hypothetical protein
MFVSLIRSSEAKRMKRYWKVLQLFWATAIAAELEYRLNFLLAALSSLGWAGRKPLWAVFVLPYRLFLSKLELGASAGSAGHLYHSARVF